MSFAFMDDALTRLLDISCGVRAVISLIFNRTRRKCGNSTARKISRGAIKASNDNLYQNEYCVQLI